MPIDCAPVEVTDRLEPHLRFVEKIAGLIDLVNSKEKIIKLPWGWSWATPIKVGDVSVTFGISEPATGRIGIRIEERYSYYYNEARRRLKISYPTSKSSDRSIHMEVCPGGFKRGAEEHALELLAYLEKVGWSLVMKVLGLADMFKLFQVDEYIRSRFEKAASGAPELLKEVISRYGDLIGEYILKAPDPHRFIVMAYAVDALPLIKKFVEQRYGSIDPDKIASWIIDDRYLHDVFLALSAVSDNAKEVVGRLLKLLPEHMLSRKYSEKELGGEIAGIILRAAGVLSASVEQLGDSRALKQVINATYLASGGGEPVPLRMAELNTSWLWEARYFMEKGLPLIDAAREVLARRYRVGMQPNANILEYAVTESYTSGHVFDEKRREELGDVLRAAPT